MESKRVAVFIDNSNVFHNINRIKDNGDKSWVCLYNPLRLAQKLTGSRNLAYAGFYCVRPPSYLLSGNDRERERYNIAQKFYSAIEKLEGIEVKYGELKGSRGSLNEKNLDTQINTDMVLKAALDEYDIAILVSSDGDYQSAVEGIKKFNKKTELLFFRGSISMKLRQLCDLPRRARRSYFERLSLNDEDDSE